MNANEMKTGAIPSRDILKVMKRIRPFLVWGGVDRAEFDKLYRSAWFMAPEVRGVYWSPLCCWLSTNLPDPTLPSAPSWAVRVSDIVEARR
jgi:hypothetical protein